MATSDADSNVILTDIQVLGLSAGQTGFASQSGVTNTSGNNSIQMTPNSSGRTQPYEDTYWHGLYFDYEEGILNEGQTYPDLQMYFKVDGKDYSSYFYVDLTQSRNMMPHRAKVNGRQYVVLGRSMIMAALNRNFGGNIPLEFLGPKISTGIDYYFTSTSGFTTGAGGTFQSPPTIKLWGDVYTQAMWDWVVDRLPKDQDGNPIWNGNISMSSFRRELQGLGPYTANFQLTAADLLGGIANVFSRLPDGPNQGKVKVHRYMKFATPIKATSGVGAFVLSNLVQGIGGAPGQVGQNNELAWAFKGTNNAVRISNFGRQPGAGAGYFGLTKGQNNVYPTDTGFGVVDTPGNPRAWYGDASLYTGVQGQYFIMPRNYAWVPGAYNEEVIAGENAGYFVAAQNGTTIAANTDWTAVGGVMVEA